MAVASAGIGHPGLMRFVYFSLLPLGLSLIQAISTILSFAVSVPVVSKSKKMMGFLRFNFAIYFEFIFCETIAFHSIPSNVPELIRSKLVGTDLSDKVFMM